MSNKQQEVIDTIRELFAESCVELFASFNCEISLSGSVDEVAEGSPISLIDAGSDELELNLTTCMPYSVLAMTYPAPEGEIKDIVDEQLDDWLSELANQLMGRLKAKLIRYQCSVLLGLPQSFFGNEIDLKEQEEGSERIDFSFEVDHEPCECLLDIRVFSDSFELAQETDDDADITSEGEIELF
jgi:hypothetical protein